MAAVGARIGGTEAWGIEIACAALRYRWATAKAPESGAHRLRVRQTLPMRCERRFLYRTRISSTVWCSDHNRLPTAARHPLCCRIAGHPGCHRCGLPALRATGGGSYMLC